MLHSLREKSLNSENEKVKFTCKHMLIIVTVDNMTMT